MQKLTFVYATRWVGLGLWGRCVSYVCKNWYYMQTKHVCIICMPKSIFAYQYHEFCFYLAYAFSFYTHFHETGLVFSSIFSLYQTIWAIKSWCIKYDTHQKSQQRFYKLLHFKTLDFSGYYSFFFLTAYTHFPNFASFFQNFTHKSKNCTQNAKRLTSLAKWSTAFKISQTLKTSQKQTFANTFAIILIHVIFVCVT